MYTSMYIYCRVSFSPGREVTFGQNVGTCYLHDFEKYNSWEEEDTFGKGRKKKTSQEQQCVKWTFYVESTHERLPLWDSKRNFTHFPVKFNNWNCWVLSCLNFWKGAKFFYFIVANSNNGSWRIHWNVFHFARIMCICISNVFWIMKNFRKRTIDKIMKCIDRLRPNCDQSFELWMKSKLLIEGANILRMILKFRINNSAKRKTDQIEKSIDHL